jgi:cyclophilin family peptidyl-prolyl cis-trans isomerase
MNILIKMKKNCFLLFFILLLIGRGFSQNIQNSEDTTRMAIILIKTKLGDIKIRLSNQTPLHRDNFLKLAQKGFYDSLLFHRIIAGFMIQGGDPYSKYAKQFVILGDSDIGYTIPAEIIPNLFHKRGMLCAARDGDDVNPKRASSGCQFYITQGRGPLTDNDLKLYEYRINKKLRTHLKDSLLQTYEYKATSERYQHYKQNKISDSLMILEKMLDEKINPVYILTPHYTFTPEQIQVYKKVGGTPHLDGSYTVFGEVLQGMETVDKITEVNTDSHDRPLENIRMKVMVLRNYQ